MATAIAEAGYPLPVWARRPGSLAALGNVAHVRHDDSKDLAASYRVKEEGVHIPVTSVTDDRVRAGARPYRQINQIELGRHGSGHIGARRRGR